MTGSTFDLADRDLGVGQTFRWPYGDGARTWRIIAIVDPEVDELVQRVLAVPADGEAASRWKPTAAGLEALREGGRP